MRGRGDGSGAEMRKGGLQVEKMGVSTAVDPSISDTVVSRAKPTCRVGSGALSVVEVVGRLLYLRNTDHQRPSRATSHVFPDTGATSLGRGGRDYSRAISPLRLFPFAAGFAAVFGALPLPAVEGRPRGRGAPLEGPATPTPLRRAFCAFGGMAMWEGFGEELVGGRSGGFCGWRVESRQRW